MWLGGPKPWVPNPMGCIIRVFSKSPKGWEAYITTAFRFTIVDFHTLVYFSDLRDFFYPCGVLKHNGFCASLWVFPTLWTFPILLLVFTLTY